MNSHPVTLFTHSRPFEPFIMFVADGRRLEVRHPEMVMAGKHAAVIWLLHSGGEIEVVDGALIASLKTVHPVDPHNFLGTSVENE